jgi:hypothetical protein
MEKQKASADMTEVKAKMETIETQFDDLQFDQDENAGSMYAEVYYVKAKTKEKCYFEFTKRQGDKILIDPRTTINRIEGKLSKVEQGTFTYENKEVLTFKLYITKTINDKLILFILNMNYTQIGRSVINSLLGFQKPIEKIYLELYKNQSGYCSLKMLINGIKAVWKYSVEDQRKHIETIKNKKGEFVSNDYSDLDNLLEDQLRSHLGILFPEADHIKFVDEDKSDEIVENKDEDTFGEAVDLTSDEAAEFFDLNKDNE